MKTCAMPSSETFSTLHDSMIASKRQRGDECVSHTHRPALHIGSPHIFPGGALLLLMELFFFSLTVSAPDCETHSKASPTPPPSPSSIFYFPPSALFAVSPAPLGIGGEKSRVSWSWGEVYFFSFLISTPHFNVIFFSFLQVTP